MAHPLLISICAFLMLLLFLSGASYRVIYKPGKFLKQLGAPVITDAAVRLAAAEANEPSGSTVLAVLHQLGSRMPSSDADLSSLRTDLLRAGFRSETAAPVFYGMRFVATAAMFAISLALQPRMPGSAP